MMPISGRISVQVALNLGMLVINCVHGSAPLTDIGAG